VQAFSVSRDSGTPVDSAMSYMGHPVDLDTAGFDGRPEAGELVDPPITLAIGVVCDVCGASKENPRQLGQHKRHEHSAGAR
jgi:hypothetical protein